jgi:hypothetical protein
MADKLLCMLVDQKTHPLHTMHGLPCQLSQPQTNYGIHHGLPVVPRAGAALGVAPERDARRSATSALLREGARNLAIAGPERRRPRPQKATAQKAPSSGKKTAHTEKNLRLVHENTGLVGSLGPTIAGKTPDNKAADAVPLASPTNATLAKDPGVQGYEPQEGLSTPPQKSRKARPCAWGRSASIASSPGHAWS